MNDKLFDDFINEKLRNNVAAVPVDMWDRIINEKSKHRKGFYWWQSLGALALISCMAVYFGWGGLFDSDKTTTTYQSISSPLVTGQPKTPVTANNQLSNNSNQPAINTQPAVPLLQGNEKLTTEKAPIANEAISKKGVVNKSLEKNIGSAKNNNQESPENLLTENTHTTALNHSSKNKTNTRSGAFLAGANTRFADIGSNELLSIRPQYDRLSLIAGMHHNANMETTSQTTYLNFKPFTFSSVDCPSDRRNGNRGLYLELFASPDIAFKNMQYKSTANNNYTNRKDSTATKQLSYSLGVRITKEIGQNIVFKTGLQYSQINEKFDYRNENERTVSTVIAIRTITNSNGTVTTIRDTSLVEQVGYRVKTTYNRYKSWDVPVIVGYGFCGEGWKADINGGAVFNLSSTQQGEFLDTSNRPASFAKTGPAIFKQKLGIGLYGSLSFIKNIGDRTALFAEPYLRYSLSDRTTNASPFTQRFHTAGVLLGIRFKLN